MGSLNLAAITATTPYIKKIQSALEKATGQTIVTPEFRKIKRVAGVSVLPVAFSFRWRYAHTLCSCFSRCCEGRT